MTTENELAELHDRLDAFETRIGDKAKELEAQKMLSPDHRKKIEEMQSRSGALRTKLGGTKPSTWTAMKKEVESEWHALTHTFESWAAHVDTDFRSRRS